MPVIGGEVRRKAQVPTDDGVVHSAEFAFTFVGGEGGVNEARKNAADLAEKAVEDFLGAVGSDNDNVVPVEEHILRHVDPHEQPMVKLIFEATNSKPRSDRIMRATTEEMTFEPNPDGNDWICTDHNERHFHVNVDKAAGMGRCDCEDFVNRGSKQEMPCKHIYALLTSADRFWNDTGRKENR